MRFKMAEDGRLEFAARRQDDSSHREGEDISCCCAKSTQEPVQSQPKNQSQSAPVAQPKMATNPPKKTRLCRTQAKHAVRTEQTAVTAVSASVQKELCKPPVKHVKTLAANTVDAVASSGKKQRLVSQPSATVINRSSSRTVPQSHSPAPTRPIQPLLQPAIVATARAQRRANARQIPTLGQGSGAPQPVMRSAACAMYLTARSEAMKAVQFQLNVCKTAFTQGRKLTMEECICLGDIDIVQLLEAKVPPVNIVE
jgi:hypothetical protein